MATDEEDKGENEVEEIWEEEHDEEETWREDEHDASGGGYLRSKVARVMKSISP